MMSNRRSNGWSRLLRVWVPGSSLFLLGGCDILTDQQLTSIATSLISTGLNTVVTQALAALIGGAAVAG